MTAPVDVLAAWDRQIEWLRDLVATNPGSECHTEELAEAIEARAAVAELMEAHRNLLENPAIRIDNFGNAEVHFAYKRARAALARCGGAK